MAPRVPGSLKEHPVRSLLQSNVDMLKHQLPATWFACCDYREPEKRYTTSAKLSVGNT